MTPHNYTPTFTLTGTQWGAYERLTGAYDNQGGRNQMGFKRTETER